LTLEQQEKAQLANNQILADEGIEFNNLSRQKINLGGSPFFKERLNKVSNKTLSSISFMKLKKSKGEVLLNQ
jgi:hypothetical protein